MESPGTAPEDSLLPEQTLYERARAAWDRADWPTLAEMAEARPETEENRDRLALLIAAGLAQQGRLDEARVLAERALDWGCPRRLAARILISGTFNSLGRAAGVLGEAESAGAYFEQALATAHPGRNTTSAARSRGILEQARLGLLPEAAGMMSEALQEITEQRSVSASEASIFKSQMELLTGALRLAQQRGQLAPGRAGDTGIERRAVSQLGQDLWVLEQTGHKRGGFFVEFGATDGVLLSNTLLLETEFGWNGICAEPNPDFFAKLKENRSCTLAPDCIAGETGREVDFVLADEYGTIADYADSDTHEYRRAAFREEGRVIRVTTISLDDFLKKFKAPRTIDYLSIDTEGSEYEILSAFPFADWDIRLLTVEHNFTPMRERIRTLLEGHGYRWMGMKFDDWYSKIPT